MNRKALVHDHGGWVGAKSVLRLDYWNKNMTSPDLCAFQLRFVLEHGRRWQKQQQLQQHLQQQQQLQQRQLHVNNNKYSDKGVAI